MSPIATIRLYFNQHGPLPWSVDKGDQSTERSFSSVDIVGVCGITRERLSPDPKLIPSAWIEFPGATLSVIGDRAFIEVTV